MTESQKQNCTPCIYIYKILKYTFGFSEAIIVGVPSFEANEFYFLAIKIRVFTCMNYL